MCSGGQLVIDQNVNTLLYYKIVELFSPERTVNETQNKSSIIYVLTLFNSLNGIILITIFCK